MNLILAYLIIYIVGFIIAAVAIRHLNSKERWRYNCIPPMFCLLSFVTVIICFACVAIDFFNTGKVAVFFKYTDK